MRVSNFHINSDYPMDKIVFLREITVTPNTYGIFDMTLSHGLGAVPYCRAVATLDGWQTTYQSGVKQLDQYGQSYEKSFQVFSNATSVRLYGWLSSGATPVTIRVWGVFNEGVTMDIDVPPTREQSENAFIINSDYNYPGLFAEGIVSLSGGDSKTVYHNLGYVPIVDIWAYEDGWWSEIDSPDCFSNTGGMYARSAMVNDSTLVFQNDNGLARYKEFYYRIYA